MIFTVQGEITIASQNENAPTRSKAVQFHCATEISKAAVDRLQHFQVADGYPKAVYEFEDAFIVPPYRCLYEKSGLRIPESCVRRGPSLTEFDANVPEIIDIPEDFATFTQPALYLSYLQNHWGHALTENTSRLWARRVYPELDRLTGVFAAIYPLHANVAALFQALGINLGQNVVVAEKPTRYKKIFVPHASFSNRGEAYTAHWDVFADVRERFGRTPFPGDPDRPVFLSRPDGLSGRSVEGLETLTRDLVTLGVDVVRTEKLTLSEQVSLFNTRRHFIGCWGSAFHNLAFASNPKDCAAHVICDPFPNTNYFMFDAILGHQAHYLCAMTQVPNNDTRKCSVSVCDADWIIDYWKQFGSNSSMADYNLSAETRM